MTGNLSQVTRTVNNPAVRQYLDASRKAEDRKKKPSGLGSGAVAAGLVGAGMGLNYIGDRALSAADIDKLNNLNSLASRMDSGGLSGSQNPEFAGTSQMFYDYVDRASQAAGAKLFGRSAPDIIEKIRKSPIMKGTEFDLAKADKFELGQSAEHYGDFEAGPLAAYVHQLRKHDETFGRSWGNTKAYIDPDTEKGVPQIEGALNWMDKNPLLAGFKKNLEGAYNARLDKADVMVKPKFPGIKTEGGGNAVLASVLNHVAKKNGGKMDTYHEFSDRFQDDMSKYLQEQGVTDKPDGAKHIRDIAKGLPHGKEMDLVRGFKGWASAKDPELAKTLGSVESRMAEGMAGPSKIYSTGGKLIKGLFRDLPKSVGTAAIIGGAGVGTYWLINKLMAASREKDLNKKRQLAQAALQGMGKPAKPSGEVSTSVRTKKASYTTLLLVDSISRRVTY